jgi:hypothetical protein
MPFLFGAHHNFNFRAKLKVIAWIAAKDEKELIHIVSMGFVNHDAWLAEAKQLDFDRKAGKLAADASLFTAYVEHWA